MPVKLMPEGKGPSFPLTSPQKMESALPGEDWISKKLDYGNRVVAVTVPFPDKLSLVTDLFVDDHVTPDLSGKSVKQLYHELDEELSAFVHAFPASPQFGVSADKQTFYELKVRLKDDFGPLGWMNLKRRKGSEYGVWRVKIDFSPFRVGSGRMVGLFDRLDYALPMFDLVKLISRARVTRLDCAIDLYGVKLDDLVLRFAGTQKAMMWKQDDDYQSLYLYEEKPYPAAPPKHGSAKPNGKQLVRIYDRNECAKWNGLPPLSSEVSITRFEVTKAWKSNWPQFDGIRMVKNMLKDRGAGFAYPPELEDRRLWRRIHKARFPIGKKWKELCGPIGAAIQLNHLYDQFPRDLIAPSDWAQWSKGVHLTGLQQFIEQQ